MSTPTPITPEHIAVIAQELDAEVLEALGMVMDSHARIIAIRTDDGGYELDELGAFVCIDKLGFSVDPGFVEVGNESNASGWIVTYHDSKMKSGSTMGLVSDESLIEAVQAAAIAWAQEKV